MRGILYLSDLSYEAKGRRYCDEDILVTDYLRTRFNVALCHPSSCAAFEDAVPIPSKAPWDAAGKFCMTP